MPTPNRHLLATEGLPAASLRSLLARARELRTLAHAERVKILAGRSLATLFFENSTRTRVSFGLAAQQLGAMVVDLDATASSLSKGETLLDTAHTVESMGVDGLIVRHADDGAAAAIAAAVQCSVFNAGDGIREHPTQALADALTIADSIETAHGFNFAGLRVAIVGDVAHSRVARSSAHSLTTLGAQVTLVGPESLCPDALATELPVQVSHDLDSQLVTADVVMMLRIQFERGPKAAFGSVEEFRDRFALTEARAAGLQPGCLIMHPGPMNRGTEIDDAVADGRVGPAKVVIRDQVAAGVAVRMAALESCLLASDSPGPASAGRATVSP